MARLEVFEQLESNVRGYCRVFPEMFNKAVGSSLFNAEGAEWIDFLSGAGSLNYGHNHPGMKQRLMEYIDANGFVNSLDFHTTAKAEFIELFGTHVLLPRELNYKLQFCGPTGTNAVEAALKLAKKVTGRHGLVSFSNSYHGMSAGSMAASASFNKRNENYLNPAWVTFMPFSGLTGLDNELGFIDTMLKHPGSGVAKPAAFIVELVQGEGGVNIATREWVRAIHALARDVGALFIVDEIQSGCGRTGKFFSFEHFGIVPDIVCLSKSVSGFGIPMSLLLMKRELDQWAPGEHNGTFRGFNYGFVTGAEALRTYWADAAFEEQLLQTGAALSIALAGLVERYPEHLGGWRALGMFGGLVAKDAQTARAIQQTCFAKGLIIEICGPQNDVLKFLPPINIAAADLHRGMAILEETVASLG